MQIRIDTAEAKQYSFACHENGLHICFVLNQSTVMYTIIQYIKHVTHNHVER